MIWPGPRRVSNLARRRIARPTWRRPARESGASHVDTPREYDENRLAAALRAVLSSPGPRRRDVAGAPRQPRTGSSGTSLDRCRGRHDPSTRATPGVSIPSVADATHRPSTSQRRIPIERMDAKQVWRAALGELQVSLSPANFETWLRDTQLVDVDEQRFRIAVPNGFAKDWLETRYRSLISQTLARIVGYSVQVEFVVEVDGRDAATATARGAGDRDRRRPAASPQVRLEPTRVGGEGGDDQPQPALHLLELHRRLGQPARPRGQPVGRRAPGPRLQPALPVRRRGPRQDPPDARHRQPGHRQVPAQARRLRDQREVHQRVHHLASSRARSTSSGPATGGSTCCSSTTSSSSPTRSGPRKSSSTRSTRSTRTASRSCCRPTGRPRRS